MRKIILGLLIGILVVSCGARRDAHSIREGLLTLNLRQQAFLSEWGKPDRTFVTTGSEIVQAGWSGTNGGFFKGKQTLEVWVYESKKTELVFGRNKLLAAWKTEASVQELSTQRTPAAKTKE